MQTFGAVQCPLRHPEGQAGVHVLGSVIDFTYPVLQVHVSCAVQEPFLHLILQMGTQTLLFFGSVV